MILALQIIYVISLILVSIRLARKASRALTKRTQGRDFHFLLFCGLAVNRLFFLIWTRTFYNIAHAPGEQELLAACYVFAIGLEWGVLIADKWDRRYGNP